MPRFTIGEFVGLTGLLGELHGGAVGTVVSVVLNKHGITALDEYEIAFDDSRQLRLCRFQLTHVGLTNKHEERENAASLCC
jgi:predicted ATPase